MHNILDSTSMDRQRPMHFISLDTLEPLGQTWTITTRESLPLQIVTMIVTCRETVATLLVGGLEVVSVSTSMECITKLTLRLDGGVSIGLIGKESTTPYVTLK